MSDARKDKHGALVTSSGFGLAVIAGLNGPTGPLPFSQEQAAELRDKYKFPESVNMYQLLTMWFETKNAVDQGFENDVPASARSLQLSNLQSATSQTVKALDRLSPSVARGLSHLVERETIESIVGDEPVYLFSIEQLQQQLHWLQLAARKKLEDLELKEPETRYRRPDYPGLFYVIECMVAPVWRQHQTKKFHADFLDEALPSPLNDCSKFTVDAVRLIDKEILTSAVRTGMKIAQKSFNLSRVRSTSAD